MRYKVLKAFNTANRRLEPSDGPGGVMDDNDVFEPFTLSDLIDTKFLSEGEEEVTAVSGIDGGADDAKAADLSAGTLDITMSPAKDAKPTPQPPVDKTSK